MQAFKLDTTQENGIPEGQAICQSPLCDVHFEQTGMKMEPRRFCSDSCRMDAWIIRRAARLLEGLSDAEIIEALKQPGEF